MVRADTLNVWVFSSWLILHVYRQMVEHSHVSMASVVLDMSKQLETSCHICSMALCNEIVYSRNNRCIRVLEFQQRFYLFISIILIILFL